MGLAGLDGAAILEKAATKDAHATGFPDVVSAQAYIASGIGGTPTAPAGYGLNTLCTANFDRGVSAFGVNYGVLANAVAEADATPFPGHIVAWKESGGFAGTYSPNAAFVQTVFHMMAGTTYTSSCSGRPTTAPAPAVRSSWPGPATGLWGATSSRPRA
jgi:hypothetical protein